MVDVVFDVSCPIVDARVDDAGESVVNVGVVSVDVVVLAVEVVLVEL